MNNPPRILIVEDEPDLRGVYTDALSEDGYQLDTAVDGDEAVQKILQGSWDIILLDIVMPKKNGFDVLETVRRTIIDPAQKQQVMDSVIFMTNLDNMTDLTHALSLGPKEYVVKTQVTPGQVQELIRNFLEKKQQASYEAPAVSTPPAAYSLPATPPPAPTVTPVLQQAPVQPVLQTPAVEAAPVPQAVSPVSPVETPEASSSQQPTETNGQTNV